MDTVQIKDNSIVYSYKGGYKTSHCHDLMIIESNKPFVNLIFTDKKVLVRISLSSIEKQLQSYFVKISRQVIFNIHHASEFVFESGSYWIYSKNGTKYKVSERREKSVQSAILAFVD